jgi:hypothetical protein
MKESEMTPEQRVILTQLLLQNATDYWYEVDHHDGLEVRDYFLEDATFFNLKGREAIHQFYVWRKSRGARTVRHLINNFRARFETPSLAITENVMLLYAADGEPVLPSAPPIQIADQIDEVVLCDDGRWRFRSRKFVNLFMGETPTTVPPSDWYEKHNPAPAGS